MKTVCRKCGKTVHEIGGYLTRVNEKGVAGIWECRPSCYAMMSPDDRVLAAIADDEAKCEGCGALATCHDSEGVPLCAECAESVEPQSN